LPSKQRGLALSPVLFIASVTLSLCGSRLYGDVIAIQQAQTTASAGSAPTQTSATLTQPGTATTSATDGFATSTATVVVTGASVAFTFQQSLPSGDHTSGSGFAEFTAGASQLYTITDPTPTTSDTTGTATFSWDVTLTDMTTGVTFYDTKNGGASSGYLTAGDTYDYSANSSVITLSIDPSLLYDPALSVTTATAVPENPAPLVPGVIGAFVFLKRLRRRRSDS